MIPLIFGCSSFEEGDLNSIFIFFLATFLSLSSEKDSPKLTHTKSRSDFNKDLYIFSLNLWLSRMLSKEELSVYRISSIEISSCKASSLVAFGESSPSLVFIPKRFSIFSLYLMFMGKLTGVIIFSERNWVKTLKIWEKSINQREFIIKKRTFFSENKKKSSVSVLFIRLLYSSFKISNVSHKLPKNPPKIPTIFRWMLQSKKSKEKYNITKRLRWVFSENIVKLQFHEILRTGAIFFD